MKWTQKFMLIWILALMVCVGGEIAVQYFDNISGFGIICAILLAPLLYINYLELKGGNQHGRNNFNN